MVQAAATAINVSPGPGDSKGLGDAVGNLFKGGCDNTVVMLVLHGA